MISQVEQAVDRFNHSRAVVLKTINKKPGMTYVQIREYIRWHEGFLMENVGARCRELYILDHAYKTEDARGRVHVYPVKEEKP